MRLCRRIERKVGRQLDAARLVARCSIDTIVDELRNETNDSRGEASVETLLDSPAADTTLVLFPPLIGGLIAYQPLVRALDRSDDPLCVLGVRLPARRVCIAQLADAAARAIAAHPATNRRRRLHFAGNRRQRR